MILTTTKHAERCAVLEDCMLRIGRKLEENPVLPSDRQTVARAILAVFDEVPDDMSDYGVCLELLDAAVRIWEECTNDD